MLKNNRILRVLAAVMTVIMVACAFAGCSAVVQDPVVAKVGDVEILYSTFYNAFSTYAQYGIIDTSNSETAKDGRQMIMDMLVNSVSASNSPKKRRTKPRKTPSRPQTAISASMRTAK